MVKRILIFAPCSLHALVKNFFYDDFRYLSQEVSGKMLQRLKQKDV